MHLGTYLGLLLKTEEDLAKAFSTVAQRHARQLDVEHPCELFSSWSGENAQGLLPFTLQYGSSGGREVRQLYHDLFDHRDAGSLALLRDLHHLWLMVQDAHITWTVVLQTASALRNEELKALCTQAQAHNHRQLIWLRTRIKSGAPQTLIAGS
jgi:hypothetical protein